MLDDVEQGRRDRPAAPSRFTSSSQYAPLLGNLAMFPMVSPTAVRQWGGEFKEHPVGTGPFQFESWTKGEQRRRASASTATGARPPASSAIVFQVVVDARQRLIDLESGSVDLAMAILPDEQPFVELHPDLVLHHTPGNDVSYLAFNTQHAAVRRRRACGAPRTTRSTRSRSSSSAYQGRAIAADGPLPPTQWGYHAPTTRYRLRSGAREASCSPRPTADGAFDPNARLQAVRAVDAAAVPAAARARRAVPPGVARAGRHPHRARAAAVSRAPRRRSRRASTTCALFGWVGDTGDPDNFLYVLFHSTTRTPRRARRTSRSIATPRSTSCSLDAQARVDEPTRAGLYAAVQDKIAADAPWVPLAHSRARRRRPRRARERRAVADRPSACTR